MGRWSQSRRVGTLAPTLSAASYEPIGLRLQLVAGIWICHWAWLAPDPDSWDVHLVSAPSEPPETPALADAWDPYTEAYTIDGNTGDTRLVTVPDAGLSDPGLLWGAVRAATGGVPAPWTYVVGA